VNPSSPQNHFELPDIEAAAAKIGRAALQAPRLGAILAGKHYSQRRTRAR
jgi:hypothetical protein